MGCNITKKPNTEVEGRKTTANGFKNLFYATTEFDLSTSESDGENEILSIQSISKNTQENLTKKSIEFSSGLTTANVNSSTTTNSTLLDNRLNQTSV